MAARKSYDGHKFGRLMVIETIFGAGDTKLRCTCECGTELLALAYNVKGGNTRSCGCLAKETAAKRGRSVAPELGARNRRHGMSGTRTYQSWRDAKVRCFNSGSAHYHRYGGRGISMDKRWVDSFDAFLADMGECPAGLTLERDDVNGNYEPGNCRWATRSEQNRNTRATKASPEIVRNIRARAAAGDSAKLLAAEYGMTTQNIDRIVKRKSWSDV